MKELLQTLPKDKTLRTSLLRPKGYRSEAVDADITNKAFKDITFESDRVCWQLQYAPKYAPPAKSDSLLA